MAVAIRLQTPPNFRTEFYGARPAVLKKRIGAVVSKTLGNPAFAAMQELVKTIQDEGKKFNDVVQDVDNGNRTLIGDRNTLTETLSTQLFELSVWIRYVALTNPKMMEDSGFLIDRADPKPKPELESPKNLKGLKSPDKGTIKLKISKVDAAFCYSFECALIMPDGSTGPWVATQWKYVNFTYTALEPGALYCIRVAALGKDGRRLDSLTTKLSSGVGEE